MKYDEALKLWGASKLQYAYLPLNNDRDIDVESVNVHMNFNEGYACCGGSDPNCYCSFAESPSTNIRITGRTKKYTQLTYDIDVDDFDFATMLKELCEVADGKVEL